MIPKAVEVRLSPEDRTALEGRVRSPATPQRDAVRARIVLLAAEGRSTRSIAAAVGVTPNTVSTWRARYAGEGLAGLFDKPRPGPKPKYDAATGQRILTVLEREPPAGFGRWTGPLIAAELCDVHEQQVWRFLRTQRIDLDAQKSWCESDDAAFVAKAADVVGLYLAPPENAIVLCVDEKPSIQALERAQGYLKLPSGRALSGHSHDYKRHGTTTLFAALDLATGKVAAAHTKRRRRVEFLAFMDDIVALYPGKQIHAVLDNLNTHKKNEAWLAAHPNVHFHYTPTRASWLNQVEIFFSILARQSLRGASFTSIVQLRQHIDAFIEAYNANASPFIWTKAEVHQRRFKGRRISHL